VPAPASRRSSPWSTTTSRSPRFCAFATARLAKNAALALSVITDCHTAPPIVWSLLTFGHPSRLRSVFSCSRVTAGATLPLFPTSSGRGQSST
jgi:hypothetical protein